MEPILAVQGWRRPFWLVLLVTISVAMTLGLACAVPLAAFSAIAAVTLRLRDAIVVSLGVWLANQVVGFAYLHYPWDASTLAWGAVLGATALLSLFAARAALRLRHAAVWLRAGVAFLIAFAAYEAALYLASFALGGTEHYTLAVQGRILALNAATMASLLVLHLLGTALHLVPAPRPSPASAVSSLS